MAKVNTSSSERLKRGQLRRKPKKKKAGSSVRVPKLWLRAEKTQSPRAARSGSRYYKENPKIPGVRRLVRR